VTHLVSLGFTRFRLDSLGRTWSLLVSLGFTWFHLPSHGPTLSYLVPCGLIWSQLVSFGLTRFRLVGLTLDSLGLTWTQLVSLGLTREKGKPPALKREKGRVHHHNFIRFPPYNQTARTHTRTNETKRNDFPVGLTPQPPIYIYIYIYIYMYIYICTYISI